MALSKAVSLESICRLLPDLIGFKLILVVIPLSQLFSQFSKEVKAWLYLPNCSTEALVLLIVSMFLHCCIRQSKHQLLSLLQTALCFL